jgi:hypothetical protein
VKHLKHLSLIAAILTVVMTPWAEAQAQTATKPAAVITLSSVDELIGDAKHVISAIGLPGIDDQLNAILEPFTAGIDRSKAIGAVVSLEGELGFTLKAFVPVKNFSQMMALVQAQLGPAQDAGNGIQQLNGPVNIFVKEQNGWAHISNSAEGLAKLPRDPLKLLGGLDESYDFAVRGNIQAIPALFRNMLISQMKAGVEATLEREPGESDEAYEVRRKSVQNQVAQMEKMVNEVEEIMIGWNYDQKGAGTYFDLALTPVKGSSLAKGFAVMSDLKSNFVGFHSADAAVRMNVTSKALPEEAAQLKITMEGMRAQIFNELDRDDSVPPNVMGALKEVLSDLMDVGIETIEAGTIDGAMAVFLKDKSVQMGGGFHVVGGKKLAAAIKKAIRLAQKEPDFPEEVQIRFDTEVYKGISFHTVTIPIPPQEEASQIFGGELQMALGTSDNSIYFGLAPNSISFLKGVIDKNSSSGGKAVRPMELSVALTPILEFASSFDDNPIVNAMIRQLKTAAGKDHVVLSVTMEKESTSALYRFQLEEGVIKAIGAGVQAGIAGGLDF